jgi:hypothetical protein
MSMRWPAVGAGRAEVAAAAVAAVVVAAVNGASDAKTAAMRIFMPSRVAIRGAERRIRCSKWMAAPAGRE